MAHYAKVDNGIVTRVIVSEPEFFDKFIDSSPGNWIQTSYNTRGGIHYDPSTDNPSADQSKALRKNFATVGYSYDEQLDAFIPPKQWDSWTLDEATCLWEAPVPMPNDGKDYSWNEEDQSWVEESIS